jgi:protein-S-isoprenylcysteine O-methyltransferase Ste14
MPVADPSMISISGFINAGCWIIFLVYWYISALRTKRIAEQQSFASAQAHRIPVTAGLLLMILRYLPQPMNAVVIPTTDWTLALGDAICVLGLFVTIWARVTLAGNWSADVTFKQDHELIRTGPYQFVRHPIYTGLLLMCIGTAITGGRLHHWLGLPLIALGFWIKLKQEERLMMQHFPDQYPAYRKEVKALVPFII